MAVTKPVLFTSIEDAEVQKNRPVSEETVRKMIQNCNLLGALAPVGSLRHVQINLNHAPSVSPDVWQLANGSEITHINSPLKTVAPFNRYTPDMTNLYVRGSSVETPGNNGVGGDAAVNINHTHGIGLTASGAQTNDFSDAGPPANAYIVNPHTHPLAADLSGAEPLELSHQQLAVYLKIN